MEPTLQSSFIPKEAIVSQKPPTQFAKQDGGMDLINILSFIVLFLSMVSAGGTFAYKTYLQSVIYGPCDQTEQLQPNSSDGFGLTAETDFKCGLYLSLNEWSRRLQDDRLARMKRLDTKMKLASGVLNSHMSLVPLFDFLSTSTLKTVRYTKIETSNNKVSLEGIASGYEDIAVESNILNSMPEVSGVMFSNINVDLKDNVTFKLEFMVNPALLKYVPVTDTNQ